MSPEYAKQLTKPLSASVLAETDAALASLMGRMIDRKHISTSKSTSAPRVERFRERQITGDPPPRPPLSTSKTAIYQRQYRERIRKREKSRLTLVQLEDVRLNGVTLDTPPEVTYRLRRQNLREKTRLVLEYLASDTEAPLTLSSYEISSKLLDARLIGVSSRSTSEPEPEPEPEPPQEPPAQEPPAPEPEPEPPTYDPFPIQ